MNAPFANLHLLRCAITPLWGYTESVFRVRFAETELSDAVPPFPDEKGRMLIGAPDPEFKLTDVSEDDKQLVVKTGQIKLRLRKEPFDLKAYDSTDKLFWAQRRSDLLLRIFSIRRLPNMMGALLVLKRLE